ncbi:hypothetical protein GCM10027278_16670 [Paralcaligenes ginsengisoli]
MCENLLCCTAQLKFYMNKIGCQDFFAATQQNTGIIKIPPRIAHWIKAYTGKPERQDFNFPLEFCQLDDSFLKAS